MKSCIFVLCFAAVVYAAPRANHLKVVSMEDNEIPMKRVKGAAVEFGGLRAGAGIGGSENGGGLWAGAEVPGANAGAGLYGGGAGAAAGTSSGGNGGVVHHDKDGFFDRIFAIPINVLHSVNTYVKSKQGSAPAHPEQGGAGAVAGASVGGSGAGYKPVTTEYGVAAGPNAQGGEDSSVRFAESEAPPSKPHGHHRPAGAKPDYDKIFNIPISALKSVNDFLNG